MNEADHVVFTFLGICALIVAACPVILVIIALIGDSVMNGQRNRANKRKR